MKKSFHRRNLPHLYYSDGIYFITFRLANSLPSDKVIQIRKVNSEQEKRLFKKYDSLLDSADYGEPYLKIPLIAKAVKHTLHYPEGKDYRLISYCIMPNHVHLLFELLKKNKGISKIMQSIKRISAEESNKLLNRKGRFWQAESFDRLVRDERELYFVIKYILLNPVKAGLVQNWNDWEYTYCRPNYIII